MDSVSVCSFVRTLPRADTPTDGHIDDASDAGGGGGGDDDARVFLFFFFGDDDVRVLGASRRGA